jgi:hypothetical protein
MSARRNGLASCLPVLVCAMFLVLPTAYADVNLEWRPETQTVVVGNTVNIGLYAVSDDLSDQSVGAMDVILSWDSTYLALLGNVNNGPYAWLVSDFLEDLGGINDDWADGDALYTAWTQVVGDPAYATPAGLLVTTLQFATTAETPGTWLTVPETMGSFAETVVYDGEEANTRVTGTLGSAMVTIIPEPTSVLLLLGGMAGIGRRRRG